MIENINYRYVFGDIHLMDIKEWKEKLINSLSKTITTNNNNNSYNSTFPLIGLQYDALINQLNKYSNNPTILNDQNLQFNDNCNPNDGTKSVRYII